MGATHGNAVIKRLGGRLSSAMLPIPLWSILSLAAHASPPVHFHQFDPSQYGDWSFLVGVFDRETGQTFYGPSTGAVDFHGRPLPVTFERRPATISLDLDGQIRIGTLSAHGQLDYLATRQQFPSDEAWLEYLEKNKYGYGVRINRTADGVESLTMHYKSAMCNGAKGSELLPEGLRLKLAQEIANQTGLPVMRPFPGFDDIIIGVNLPIIERPGTSLPTVISSSHGRFGRPAVANPADLLLPTVGVVDAVFWGVTAIDVGSRTYEETDSAFAGVTLGLLAANLTAMNPLAAGMFDDPLQQPHFSNHTDHRWHYNELMRWTPTSWGEFWAGVAEPVRDLNESLFFGIGDGTVTYRPKFNALQGADCRR